MERNLPAAPEESPAGTTGDRPPVRPRQPISVAFLPLGLVTFIVLAFVMAAWTFMATAY